MIAHLPAIRACFPLGMVACALAGGCRFLPPNYLALNTAERGAPHPKLLNFTHGLALNDTENGRGVTVLAGDGVLLWFDHAGPSNRVRLLFHRDGSRALYERIGQRRLNTTPPAETAKVGIRAAPGGQQLRGSIDVFVSISERPGLEASACYERYPRVMRLIGFFAVPLRPADHPQLTAALSPIADGRELLEWALDLANSHADLLVRLPILDVKYLVPTTLADRLIHRP